MRPSATAKRAADFGGVSIQRTDKEETNRGRHPDH
jgi:hypothetical protein